MAMSETGVAMKLMTTMVKKPTNDVAMKPMTTAAMKLFVTVAMKPPMTVMAMGWMEAMQLLNMGMTTIAIITLCLGLITMGIMVTLLGSPQWCPPPQVPSFPLGRPRFRVCVPPFWTGFSPTGVHEGHESGGYLSTQPGYSLCNLLRRPPSIEQEPYNPEGAYFAGFRPAGSTRLPGELSKVSSATLTAGTISGFPHRLIAERATPPKNKPEPDKIIGGLDPNE